MTKVKICGVTNVNDGRNALKLGADMLGFNFYENSPRYVSPRDAHRLIQAIGEDTYTVGVFVNMEAYRIDEIVKQLDLKAVQIHGNESADFVKELRRYTDAKIIKAFRVDIGFQVDSISDSGADAVLLDAFAKDAFGGTGKSFNWETAHAALNLTPELFLAGGLTPQNVATAVRTVRPYAVDVASGVEMFPGKKDPEKLKVFIENAKNA